MVHLMMVARVCGPQHDGRRHANKNEDLWESVHCVVRRDLGLVLVHAWCYEGDRKLNGVTCGDIMDRRKEFTREAESGAIDKFCR